MCRDSLWYMTSEFRARRSFRAPAYSDLNIPPTSGSSPRRASYLRVHCPEVLGVHDSGNILRLREDHRADFEGRDDNLFANN